MPELYKGALSNVPKTFNLQSATEFRFFIKRMPNVNYFVNKVNIPAVMLGSADEPTPFLVLPQPGDHVIFEPLVLTFLVSEGLENLIELHKWFRTIGNLDGQQAYDKLNKPAPNFMNQGVKSDILVSILDAAKNPVIEVDYLDAWPTSITGLSFNATQSGSEAEYLTVTATFKYSLYNFRTSP